MSRATQCQKLLEHLQTHPYITSYEAMWRYNILRPSNRIQELKAAGHDIRTEIVWKKTKDGSTTHYAKYSLAS